MIMIKIIGIEEPIMHRQGEIYQIEINNQIFFRKLYYDAIEENPDIFIYSEDYKIKEYTKNNIFIFNLMQINPNERKLLTAIYKKLALSLNDQMKNDINDLNVKLISIIDELSFNLDLTTTFNTSIDITKLLSMCDFMFEVEGTNLISLFITYLKACLELKNIKFIISFDILKHFSNDEIILLKKELDILNICLIDLKNNSIIEQNLFNKIVIDSDLCQY